MEIEWATVVPGSESETDDGVSKPVRCVLQIEGKPSVAAILKRIPRQDVVAEAFVSIVFTAWNIPVPTPYLVAEQGFISFASAEAQYPSLKKRLLPQQMAGGPIYNALIREAAKIASTLKTARMAAAADEAIDNRDRNLGNVLWDGNDELWIDHALSLGNGLLHKDRNILCEMATGCGLQEDMLQGALAWAHTMDRDAPTRARETLQDIFDTQVVAAYLASRLSQLAQRLLRRFPQPTDLLMQP